MRLLILPVNRCLLVYFMLLLLISISNLNEAYGQSVSTSDQVAKEGDTEVVITCDYLKDISELQNIKWDEVNEDGSIIDSGIVNDIQPVNGRYTLRTKNGKADLVISKPVRNDNQRRFQCEIQLLIGGYIFPDHPSVLTVYYIDEPVLNTSASIVYEGQAVILTCSKPDGNPAPNTTWYKDEQALNTTDATRFTTSEDALEMHIKAATVDDSGNYTCKSESDQFKREEGKSSYQIDLKVIYLDKPVLHTSVSSVYEGQSVTLTCSKPDGDPVPNDITWYKDGRALNTTDTSRFATSEDALEIQLKSATPIDGGWYKCKAESDKFRGNDGKTSNQIDLKVMYLDDPVLRTSASNVYEGQSVTLTCSKPGGYPVPSITWYKDGQAFDTTDTTRFITSEDALEIHIKAATTDDSGNYMCKAENDEFKENDGKTSNQFYLEIKGYYGVRPPWYVIFIVVMVLFMVVLWIAFLLFYIFCKGIEMTKVVEGDGSLEIRTKYRPSIASIEIVQWEDIAQNEHNRNTFVTPKLCSSTTYFFKYVLRCCIYFCGICCKEYSKTWKIVKEKKRRKKK